MVSYTINNFPSSKKYLVSVIYMVLIFLSALPFLNPLSYQDYPDTFYSTNQDTTTVKNEYMPKWVNQIPPANTNVKVQNLSTLKEIVLVKNNANATQFEINLDKPSIIQINTIYFPGWEASANGRTLKIYYDNLGGLIRLNLDKGENNVLVYFKETNIRLISDFISILSIAALFAAYFIFKKKRYNL